MKTSLITFDASDISELYSWFNNDEELKTWAGPNLQLPCKEHELAPQILTSGLSSFGLYNENKQLIGFGQFYLRLQKCHLARLVISPKFRGKSLAKPLIEQLMANGTEQLEVTASSLFVYKDNKIAINAYQKMGFTEATYLGDPIGNDMLYMVKE